MFEACLPLAPCTTSKLTFCPSLSDLNPLMLMALKWANRSSPPSFGVINPKPFASLNHLTVPVAISLTPCIKHRASPLQVLHADAEVLTLQASCIRPITLAQAFISLLRTSYRLRR